jgi:hypothetical protein
VTGPRVLGVRVAEPNFRHRCCAEFSRAEFSRSLPVRSALPLRLGHHVEIRAGLLYIVGQVRSNGNKRYGYVSIIFSLYDKSGAKVGTALAGISGLNAKGLWRFRAVVAEKDAANFELQSLSGL